MKKSILQFSVIAAIAASMTLTTSCSSDDSAEAYVPEPVSFNIGLNTMKASTRTLAAASNWLTVNDEWGDGMLVGIKTKDADNVEKTKTYVTSNSSTYTAQLNGSGLTNTFYWQNKTEDKSVTAWSFGNKKEAVATDPVDHDFTINTDQSTKHVESTDDLVDHELLYAYQQSVKYTDGTKSLTLYHQLAKIIVKFVTEKEDGITECHFGYNNDLPLTGTFSAPSLGSDHTSAGTLYSNWTFKGDGTKGVVTPRYHGKDSNDDPGTSSQYQYRQTFSGVLIPGNYSDINLFYLTYDGTAYAYKETTDATKVTFKAGYVYTFIVKVGSEKLSIASATIYSWDTGSSPTVDAVLQ